MNRDTRSFEFAQNWWPAIGNSLKAEVFALALCAAFFVLCTSGEAQQQAGKIPRIGYISSLGNPNNPGPLGEAFRQGLRDHGYVEGKNIMVEYRNIEGERDRIPGLVSEVLELNVDLLVVTSPPSIRAAQQATKTIPIVIMADVDPVATGLVDSFAHPGGNITGLARLTGDLSGKRLELLKEVIPTISRVGVLRNASGPPGLSFKEYEAAAPALKLQLQSVEVRGPNPDLEGAFRAAAKWRINALLTILNPLLNRHKKQIADLAMNDPLPSMCEAADYVEAGCLTSYSANDAESFKRAAYYVDKILKGAKPAELPVEQPTKFEFVVNLKTAKQIGLTIPPNVLARADRVIK